MSTLGWVALFIAPLPWAWTAPRLWGSLVPVLAGWRYRGDDWVLLPLRLDAFRLAARGPCAAMRTFVKALSKILHAGQALSVTIPRTPWRFDPLTRVRNVRNCVFRQL